MRTGLVSNQMSSRVMTKLLKRIRIRTTPSKYLFSISLEKEKGSLILVVYVDVPHSPILTLIPAACAFPRPARRLSLDPPDRRGTFCRMPLDNSPQQRSRPLGCSRSPRPCCPEGRLSVSLSLTLSPHPFLIPHTCPAVSGSSSSSFCHPTFCASPFILMSIPLPMTLETRSFLVISSSRPTSPSPSPFPSPV